MTESEVISRVHAAQRELKPLLDFINDGDIHPNNGCLSYTYGAAQLRANDVVDALSKLLVTGMQHARERAATSASQ